MNLRSLLLDNWGLKFTALALSLALWFYATSKGKTELALTVPLELRNVPQGMAVVGDVREHVDVRLQGQERALRDITARTRVVAIVDLAAAVPGKNVIRLEPDDIRRPAGVAVVRITPYEIAVNLDRIISKTFRLRPRVRGVPAEGYAVTGAAINPARVTVEGPERIVRTIEALQTMPVDIDGARRTVTVTPRIDYRGRSFRVLEKNVTVTVTIEKEKEKTTP